MSNSTERRKDLVVPVAVGAGVGVAAVAGYVALRVARFVIGRVVTLWGVAAFALRVVTLRAYRRCPDCRSRVDRRAAVCRHCGYRKSG